MIPAGSLVTYQAKTKTGFFSSPPDIVNAISTAILDSGFMTLDRSISTPNILEELIYGGSLSNYPFSFVLHIKTNQAYGDADSIKSIIDHAVYVETGSLPPSSIPVVQVPGGSETPTGDISQLPQGSSPATSSLSSWFSSLGTQAALGIGLVGVGIIVALVLITGARTRVA